MKFLKDERVKKNIFVGVVLIIVFFIIYNIGFLWTSFTKLLSIMSPFIMGAAIAFVLNVPMGGLEKRILSGPKFTGRKWRSRRRAISLTLTIVLTIVLLSLILEIIVPQMASSIGQLVKKFPAEMNNLEKWVDNTFEKYPALTDMLNSLGEQWTEILDKLISFLKNYLSGILEGGINAITGLVSGVINFTIGFIFALYILGQKETLGLQARKIIYAFFDEDTANATMRVAGLANKTFAGFVSGQCVEAIILGLMFAVSMLLLRIPYALLVSVLIAVTALIPIVGTFIALAVGGFLIFLESPVKALVFLVLFLILQQIEGKLIYPKVVGESVGLPGIWVLFSVTIGGSLFGVGGMVVFIPLVSVAYAIFREFIYQKLEDKGILDDFAEDDEDDEMNKGIKGIFKKEEEQAPEEKNEAPAAAPKPPKKPRRKKQ